MSKRLASPYGPPNTTTGSNHPAQTEWFGSLSPVARDSDPLTSHKAHDRIAPKRNTRAAQVLATLRAYKNGLTAQEVESYLTYRDLKTGKQVTGWWKRLSDLKNAGLVRGTGEERDGGEVYIAVE